MKCDICKTEIAEGMSACPVCGFPVLYVVGSAQMPVDYIEAVTAAYKKKLLQSLRVSVLVFSWKKSDDEIVLNEKHKVQIATGEELLAGQAVWLNEEFARTVSEPAVELTYELQTDKGKEEGTVKIAAPQDASLWKVGAVLTEDMKLKLLIKSDIGQTESDSLPFLR